MRRVLVTGMSGTGKSSALVELRRRGFEVVDTDEPGWTEWRADVGHVWDEERLDELLARDRDVTAVRVRHGLEPGPLLPAVRRGRSPERARRRLAPADREHGRRTTTARTRKSGS